MMRALCHRFGLPPEPKVPPKKVPPYSFPYSDSIFPRGLQELVQSDNEGELRTASMTLSLYFMALAAGYSPSGTT